MKNANEIPRPLRDFLERARKLETSLFPQGLTEDALTAHLEKGRHVKRDILNYGYALLGAGTLLLRFLAVILLRRYLETRLSAQPSAVFHRLVLEHLHDRLPLDSNWAAVLDGACSVLEEDSWSIVREAAKLNGQEILLPDGKARFFDLFVRIRNRFAHEDLPENPKALLTLLQHLKTVAESLSIFAGCQFEDVEGKLFLLDNYGERLSLHPFAQSGESVEPGMVIPYLFQGLYEGRSVLKLLGTAHGNETRPDDAQTITDEFRRLGRQALGLQSEFNFNALIDRYLALFVGRDKETEALLDFCAGSTEERYLAVHAPPGMGKSALLADLARRLEKSQHPVIYHFCGSGEANNPLSVLSGLLARGKKGISGDSLWKNQPPELVRKQEHPPGSYDAMIALFQDTLSAYTPSKKAAGKNLIVLIDGVDQALVSYPDLPLSAIFTRKEKTEDGETTEPYEIPENVRIIFGYRTGRYREAGKSARMHAVQPVPALGADSVHLAFKSLQIAPDVTAAILERGRPAPAAENEGRMDPGYLRFVYDEMAAGRLSTSNAAAIPPGLTGQFDRALTLAEPVFARMRRLRVFTAFALSQRAVPVSFVASLLSEEEDYVRDLVEEHASWFNAEQGRRIAFYHERLRMYFLQRSSERELLEMNERYLQLCRKWKDLSDSEERSYALEHFARHLSIHAEMTETRPYPRSMDANAFELELSNLVLDQSFRDAQVAATRFYNHSIHDAKLALEHAVHATAGFPGDDIEGLACIQTGNLPRLCQLVLHAGETGAKAQSDLSIVAQWAREGKVEEALERVLVIKDEQLRFQWHFLILWEIVDSQQLDDVKKKECCEAVMRHIDETLPPGTESVDWGRFEADMAVHQILADCLVMAVPVDAVFRRSDDFRQAYCLRRWAQISGRSDPQRAHKLLEYGVSRLESLPANACLIAILPFAQVMTRMGSTVGDKHLLRRVVDRGQSFEPRESSPADCGRMAQFFGAVGAERRARDLIEIGRELLRTEDDLDTRLAGMIGLAEALGSLRALEEARDMWQRVGDELEWTGSSGASIGTPARVAWGWRALGEREKSMEAFAAALQLQSPAPANIFEMIQGVCRNWPDAQEADDTREWLDRLLQVAQTIDDAELRVRAEAMLANLLIRQGERSLSARLLIRVREELIAMSDSEGKALALCSMGAGFSALGKLSEAAEACEQAVVSGSHSAEWCVFTEERAKILGPIVEELLVAGERGKARGLFARVPEPTEGIEDGFPLARTIRDVAQRFADYAAQARAHRELLEIAMQLLEWLPASERDVEAWCALGGAHAQFGNMPTAAAALSCATDAAALCSDPRNRALAFERVARGYVAAGDNGLAATLLERALGFVPEIDDAESRAAVLLRIALGVELLPQGSDIRVIWKEIATRTTELKNRVEKGRAMAILAGAPEGGRADLGLLGRALDIAASTWEGERAPMLVSIAAGLKFVAERDLALTLFERLRNSAESIEDASSRVSVYCALASALDAMGEAQKSRAMLEIAVGEASTAAEPFLLAQILSELGVSLDAAGDGRRSGEVLEQALDVVRRMQADYGSGASATDAVVASIASVLVRRAGRQGHTLRRLGRAVERLGRQVFGGHRFRHSISKWQEILSGDFKPTSSVEGSISQPAVPPYNTAHTFAYIVRSLCWSPADPTTAYGGIHATLAWLASQGEIEGMREITQVCPQLGLTEVLAKQEFEGQDA